MKTLRVGTRYGEMFVAAADNCVGRSIVEYGEWAQGEIDLLEQIVQPGMTVLDIGANVGYHTLALAKAVGSTGTVVSFEPQHPIFQLLAANIAINNLSNVTALNMALGEKRGLVDMPLLNYDVTQNFGSFGLRDFLGDEEASLSHTPVSLQRLDDIALVRNASVLKLDVEGMELAVLRGGLKFIQRRRPVLFVENHTSGDDSEQLLSFLEELNYECYWHISPAFNPYNFNNNSHNFLGRYMEINTLAAPREAISSIEGMPKVKNVDDHPKKWILA